MVTHHVSVNQASKYNRVEHKVSRVAELLVQESDIYVDVMSSGSFTLNKMH